ncbi:alpha/beta fold hydrolase [Microvirga roseola]|uniref:alpha/beta fold hydrolase n=1 Tax=Microvirga roseola TaxID=2883126 RepID=UPI001E598872|nr:alpha/beta hydrolase [Microvirga roseola]
MNILLLAVGLIVLLFAAGAVFTHLYARRVARLYPPVGRFIEIDGCRLHYLERGPEEGEALGTIVLLHGASSNLVEIMLGLGSQLARYRVIAFDRPGFGWSERRLVMETADPSWQAEVIAKALRRLGIRNAVVVGHSWSGTIAPHFALDHTDVAGAIVVLAGITSPWPGGYVGWYRRIAASWFGRLLSWTVGIPITLLLRRQALRKTFAPCPVPPDFMERAAVPVDLRPRPFHATAQDLAAMYDAVRRQSLRYAEIRMPVLVIAGDSDEIVWTDLHSRSFVREVPGAELVVLPSLGHMPHYARPDLVIPRIEALAARIAPARAGAP